MKIRRINANGFITHHGTTSRELINRNFSNPRLVSDGFGGAYDFVELMQRQDATCRLAAKNKDKQEKAK